MRVFYLALGDEEDGDPSATARHVRDIMISQYSVAPEFAEFIMEAILEEHWKSRR